MGASARETRLTSAFGSFRRLRAARNAARASDCLAPRGTLLSPERRNDVGLGAADDFLRLLARGPAGEGLGRRDGERDFDWVDPVGPGLERPGDQSHPVREVAADSVHAATPL